MQHPTPLESLAPPNERRIAVRVTPDALRQIRGGHPWVYESSIMSLSHDGSPGDLAVVFDSNRRFAAIGLYDPASPIRIRVLHRGKPAQIDASWWTARVDATRDLRRTLAASAGTTAYRCINGEGDGFPGLVLDRYGDVHVMKLYSAAWLPHLRAVVPVLADRLGISSLVLRVSRALEAQPAFPLVDGSALLGEAPRAPVPFLEHGLSFEADVVRGHKTGYFLDQRDNRARVGSRSRGCRVLDVFSYTGGFALHAAAGGATTVHSVDINPHASETVSRLFDRNRADANVRSCRLRTSTGDAFDVMRDLRTSGERFDLVVIDPPSFASKQADVPRALHAYGRLTELGLALVATGGTLMQASCSARVTSADFFETIHETAQRCGVRLDEIERTGHAIDHPVRTPEGEYLKALFAVVHHPDASLVRDRVEHVEPRGTPRRVERGSHLRPPRSSRQA